jgi:4-alpha-glucanotransferase
MHWLLPVKKRTILHHSSEKQRMHSEFCWLTERGAGILLHPTSLPGAFGIGTFGENAKRFIDFLADSQSKYWQVCPLGPTGFGDSPYQCFSAFAGNPYLIDLTALVIDGFLTETDLDPLRQLPEHCVDYGLQWERRWPILRHAFTRFKDTATLSKKDELTQFTLQNRIWLEPYARFLTIKQRYAGQPWSHWPQELKHFEASKKALKNSELGEEFEVQQWLQFQFFKQWHTIKKYANEKGIRIIGDIPIFVSMDSADVWTYPKLFLMDENLHPTGVAGVPPDYFSADGQLWGNPLYNWPRHRSEKFAWWLKRLKTSFDIYDVVRIDHFRGFESYCKIPPDAVNARTYTWEPGPGIELFEAIKQAFPDAKLVAEDLGLITPEVRKLVDDTGLPGMKVMQFGFEGATEYLPHNTIPNSVLYPGTHDNDTAWGWYRKQSEQVQDFFRRYLQTSGEAVPWDMIRAGYASTSRIFIAPMQDLLDMGSEARLNTPGRPTENWRWRMTHHQFEVIRETSTNYLRELATLYQR